MIKAKYPAFHRPFMHCERQGYGSYRGGNTSVVSNADTEHSIVEDRASDFPNS